MRYTTSDNFIYATVLGKPEGGKEYLLQAFSSITLPTDIAIQELTLLGSDTEINWKKEKQGLKIQVPEGQMDEMAVVFKIELE
ncbi:MAG: alpha-L-fucosidase C-terminal domain-containing protein [Acidobacteriota bacterium]